MIGPGLYKQNEVDNCKFLQNQEVQVKTEPFYKKANL